jgi:hypothetical protein
MEQVLPAVTEDVGQRDTHMMGGAISPEEARRQQKIAYLRAKGLL